MQQIRMGNKLIFLLLSLTAVKSDILPANLLSFQNYTVADTNTICSYFRTADISEKCGEQLEIICENSTLLMTMLDASAKFPYAGLGYSTRMDYGNFDQCLSITHDYKRDRILGEYCFVGLVIPDIFGNLTDPDSLYELALCRPNGCAASDYNAIVLNLTSVNISIFQDIACQTVETNSALTAGDIITICIFTAVTLLMIVSTLFDLFLYTERDKSVHPLLLSFSVLTNGRKLLHISKHSSSKEQIEIFYGIRVISMMWIVAGHGFALWSFSPVINMPRVTKWEKDMSSFYVTAAPLAVDTFFFMSGFLLAFQYLKDKTRTLTNQVVSIPNLIIHRYLRLTPALLMVYLVTITIFVHLGSGPLWHLLSESNADQCKKYWWRFFLYIQNYYDTADICLGTTWYLSADIQLFLLSSLLLIPLSFQLKQMGLKVVIVELLIWNIFWTFLPMTTKLLFPDHEDYYETHPRVINYSIGIMLGLFMRVQIDKPFLYIVSEGRRSAINLITWVVIILGMLATVVCYQDQKLHHKYNSQSVFESLMRPAWCVGLSWITYSCYHGYGGFVNWILCRPIYQVLARLTYCIYLVHMTVMFYTMGTTRTKLYFTDYNAFYVNCGYYVVSVIIAIFWTLSFESPLIVIEKYFLGGNKKSNEVNLPRIEKQSLPEAP